MPIAKVKTYANVGLDGYEVIIEADSAKSLPTIEIIGLPDASIKEAKERIRATFRNVGLDLPRRKLILNLAPSDLRKVGTRFDLPMAVALLMMISPGGDNKIIEDALFFGELGLDGEIKRVNGLLPSVIHAMDHGHNTFFVPEENIHELRYLQGATLYPIANFRDFVDMYVGDSSIEPVLGGSDESLQQHTPTDYLVDFADIKGHLLPKRALTIAAAGFHNILMIGAPGSGKTMLAKAIQSILPPMQFSEVLESSQIYSLIGKLDKDFPLVTMRPFRAVHHTASKVAIVGGGQQLTPGEISLAHNGILFFDEVPEFPRVVLEVLRQPLEDHTITISRAHGSVEYPAHFMFVGAMNPCKCGFYKDPEKTCSCSQYDIHNYQSKISGPLLDRFDMLLEVPRERLDTILDTEDSISSADLREQVHAARERQKDRFAGSDLTINAQMGAKHIQQYVPLGDTEKAFLKKASDSLHLSARVIHRLIKLARTIADIAGVDTVDSSHLAEALQYRSKTMFTQS